MLNWVTFQEPVMTIPKAGRVSHVEENARSIDARISQADYEALAKKFE
jgi:diketogulonate reductase-like aldo/keto reductase